MALAGVFRGFFPPGYFARFHTRPVIHGHVAHAHHQRAFRLGGELRRQFLFLILEIREFHFYQFLTREFQFQGGHQAGRQTIVPHLDGWFEVLRARFQFANQTGFQFFHAVIVTSPGGWVRENPCVNLALLTANDPGVLTGSSEGFRRF